MKNRICIWFVNLLLRRKRMTLNKIQEELRAHNADYNITLHRNTYISTNAQPKKSTSIATSAQA